MNSEGVRKHLVFHFYTGEGVKNEKIIRIHLECLRYYCEIFDDALIVISHDKGYEQEASEIAKEVFKIPFKNLTIKRKDNTVYREALTFKEEITDKINAYQGLIFFGHSKGISNYEGDKYNTNLAVLYNWIYGLYFLNLDDINDVINTIFGNKRMDFYGAYLMEDKDRFIYSGTFYWFNADSIKNRGVKGYMQDLAYAEDFPSHYINPYEGHGLASYNSTYIFRDNLYNNDKINFLCSNNINNFNNFKKIIEDNVG